MTRLLIVDDEPRQLRLLSRLFSAADPSLSLETCATAAEAIECLQAKSFDVVLTDIQMPGMDGLELVAWLLSNQPELPVFTMTAYPDADAERRLGELGCIECFTKPIAVKQVLQKIATTLTNDVAGHIRNFSLVSFLQLVKMEQKTCTLHVASKGRRGNLYFDRGELVEAKTGDQLGDDAAINIVAWGSPAITITGTCDTPERTIESSANFILMEAMRLQDEASQSSMDALEPFELDVLGEMDAFGEMDAPKPFEEELEFETGFMTAEVQELDQDAPPHETQTPVRRFSNYPMRSTTTSADLLALIRLDTGEVKVVRGRKPKLRALAQLGAQIYAMKREAVRQLDSSDVIGDIAVTTSAYGTVVRPLPHTTERVAVLVFDRATGNLALRNAELAAFVRDLGAWIST